eukprot:15288647-Alexandrium_andersonii.AAC.1
MAAQHVREGRALPEHVARRLDQGRATASSGAERPSMCERALLAAEAAEAITDERIELDYAGFVNFDLKDGLGPQSQDGAAG